MILSICNCFFPPQTKRVIIVSISEWYDDAIHFHHITNFRKKKYSFVSAHVYHDYNKIRLSSLNSRLDICCKYIYVYTSTIENLNWR